MQFWSVANYALAGAALVFLTPISNLYLGSVLVAVLGISLVELRVYSRIEGVIATLVLAIFASYLVIVADLNPSLGALASGFVPRIAYEFDYLTVIIALLGTTVYLQTARESRRLRRPQNASVLMGIANLRFAQRA